MRLPAAVLLGLLLTACGSASGQPSPTASPKASADWSTIVAAAKKEGVVQCGCPPRPDFARVMKEGFEAANPGIRLEVTPAPLPEFPVRVEKEQQAGQFLWDIYTFGPGPEVFDLKNKGGFAPLRDYMVGPDIGDDSKWNGGLAKRFLDSEGKYIFAYWHTLNGQVTVNRDVLPDADIKSYADLMNNPAYKGKAAWVDPRIGGSGSNLAAFVYKQYGRDGLKKLLVDQQPLLVKGNTDAAEQVVRGSRAIALPALSADTLIPYKQAGAKLNLVDVGTAEMLWAGVGGSSPGVLKNPPHPNATKVFVNWLLSRDGQALMAEKLVNNSARLDVPPGEPANAPKPGVDYWNAQTEDSLIRVRQEAQQAARQLVP